MLNGYIYRVECSHTGQIYIGSTVGKEAEKALKIRKGKGYKTCACKNFVNPTISLLDTIEDCPCTRYLPLRILEQEYIEKEDCINVNRAYTTKEIDNAKALAYYHRTKVEKDVNGKKRRDRIKCPHCQVEIRRDYLKHHVSIYCEKKNLVYNNDEQTKESSGLSTHGLQEEETKEGGQAESE